MSKQQSRQELPFAGWCCGIGRNLFRAALLMLTWPCMVIHARHPGIAPATYLRRASMQPGRKGRPAIGSCNCCHHEFQKSCSVSDSHTSRMGGRIQTIAKLWIVTLEAPWLSHASSRISLSDACRPTTLCRRFCVSDPIAARKHVGRAPRITGCGGIVWMLERHFF